MATWTVDEDASNFSLLNCNKGKINMLEMITGSTAPAWDFISRIFFISGVGTSYDAYTHQFFGGGARNRFMNIDENGNVGINVSGVPVQKLDVNGNINTSGSVASNVQLTLQNGVSPRWVFSKFNTETGSNVGSDLAISRYNDSGVFVDTPVTIVRSTGAVSILTDLAANKLRTGQLEFPKTGIVRWNIHEADSGYLYFERFNSGGSSLGAPIFYYPSGDVQYTEGFTAQKTCNFCNTSGDLYIGVTARNSAISIVTDGAANSGAFVIATTNAGTLAERMRISASGNVGIGHNNPPEKLTVSGNILGTAVLNISGVSYLQNWIITYTGLQIAVGASIMLMDSNAFKWMTSNNLRWALQKVDADDLSYFRYNDAGVLIDRPFTILRSNGNVGIGVSNPGYKLDVAGDIRLDKSTDVRLIFANAGVTKWSMYYNAGDGSFGIVNPSNNSILFYTSGTLINPTTGNVAIGNFNPAYKLDVTGDINCTGTYRVNGVALSTGTGQNQSPWLSNIDASNFDLLNLKSLVLKKTSAGVDEKLWSFTTTNTQLVGYTLNDAGTPMDYWLMVHRGGTSAYQIQFTKTVQVSALIESTSGGFKFPDSTIQTTAALTKAAYQTPWTQNIAGGGFQLTGVSRIDATGIIYNATTSNVDYHWYVTNETANQKWWRFRATTGGLFRLDLIDDTSGVIPIMTFKRSGGSIVGVGIGKTPVYALDVVGDVNITGNYKVNGVNLSTGGSQTPWTSDIDAASHNLETAARISVAAPVSGGVGSYASGIEIREVLRSGANSGNINYAPRLLFNWSGVDFTQIGMDSSATIRTFGASGGYASFACSNINVNGDINFTGKLYHNGVEVDLGTTDLTPVLNRLPAALVGGKMDSVVSAPVTIQGDLTTEMKVSIRNEISGEFDEPGSELSTIPTTAGSIRRKIDFIFQYFRNKRTITSSIETLYKEGGADPLGGTTVQDDGTTVTVGEKN